MRILVWRMIVREPMDRPIVVPSAARRKAVLVRSNADIFSGVRTRVLVGDNGFELDAVDGDPKFEKKGR